MSKREEDIEAALAAIRGGAAQRGGDIDSALAEIRGGGAATAAPPAPRPRPRPKRQVGAIRRAVNWFFGGADEDAEPGIPDTPQRTQPLPAAPRAVELGQQMHDAGMALDPTGTRLADNRVMQAFTRSQRTPLQRLSEADPAATVARSDATSTPGTRERERREARSRGTPSTIGPDERTPLARQLAEGRAERVEALSRRPRLVRDADAFLGEGAQSLTLGYRDEIMGALTPGATAEDFERTAAEERDSRDTRATVAGVGGAIVGAAVPIGGQNALLARAARFAPEGTAVRAGLEAFGHTGARTLMGDVARGAVEGIPYDLAYDYDNPDERGFNMAVGLAGGALAGGTFRSRGPRGEGHAAAERAPITIPDLMRASREAPVEVMDALHDVARLMADGRDPSDYMRGLSPDVQRGMGEALDRVRPPAPRATAAEPRPAAAPEWEPDPKDRSIHSWYDNGDGSYTVQRYNQPDEIVRPGDGGEGPQNVPVSPTAPAPAPSTPVEPGTAGTGAASAPGGALDVARRIADAGERPTVPRVMREAGVSEAEARAAVRQVREGVPGAPAAADPMAQALDEIRGGQPATAQPAADLPEGMGNAGRGVVDGMYDMLWRSVQAGETMEGGRPSLVLQIAQRLRQLGGMQTPEDLRALAQDVANARGEVSRGRPFQEAMQAVVERHLPQRSAPELAGPAGREASVAFPDGSKVQARYRVVEADDIQPSHHPVSFQANPDYPAGVQGRDYHRDTAAQERIAEHTQGFDSERLLDPTSLVASGPPLVTPGGVAVAGNERTMLRQRIRELNPDADAAYRQGLMERASYYGVDPAEIERMRHPMLVRELADGSLDLNDPEVLRELNARSDQEVGKVKDPLSDAATRARQMRGGQALQHFAGTFSPDQTLRDYLGGAQGRQFVRQLVDDGVIPRAEMPRYIDTRTGALNSQGTAMVERALYLSAIPDPDIVDAAAPALLQQLEPSIPHLVQAAQVPGWDLGPVLRDALGLSIETRGKGLRSVDDLLANVDMFGRQSTPGADDLARFLERSNRKQTRAFFQDYAKAAQLAERMAQSDDLFGALPPEQASTFRSLMTSQNGVAERALLNLVSRTGVGALAGGAVGGQTGNNRDERVRNAVVGAVLGAAAAAGISLPFARNADESLARLRADAMRLQQELRSRPRSPAGFISTTADELAATPHPSDVTRDRTGFPMEPVRRPGALPDDATHWTPRGRPGVVPLDTERLTDAAGRVTREAVLPGGRLAEVGAMAAVHQLTDAVIRMRRAGRTGVPADLLSRVPGIGLLRADGGALDQMAAAVLRGAAGATIGALGEADTPEERLTNAALFAALGVGAPAAWRYLRGMDQIGAVGPRDPLGRARFYSRLEQAIADGQKAASGEQWLRFLNNRPGGIAKGEREWTGIDRFLEERKGQRVTKQEMADYMAQNRININEVVRREGGVVDHEAARRAEQLRPETDRARAELERALQEHYGPFNKNAERILEQLQLGMSPEELLASDHYAAVRTLSPAMERYHRAAAALVEAEGMADPHKAYLHAQTKYHAASRELREAAAAMGARVSDTDAQHIRFAEKLGETTPLSDMGRQNLARLRTAVRRYEEVQSMFREAERAWDASRPRYSSFVVPGGENYREVLLTLPGAPVQRVEGAEALNPVAQAMVDGHFIGPHWDEPNVMAHIRMDDRTLPNGERVLFVHEIQSDWHQAGREQGYRRANMNLVAEDAGGYWQVNTTDEGGFVANVFFEDASTAEEAIAVARQRLLGGENHRAAQMVPDAPFKGTQEWMGLAVKRVIDEAVEGGYDRVVWSTGRQIQEIVGGVEEGQSEFYDQILPRWVEKYIKKTGGKLEQVEISAGAKPGEGRYRYAGPELTDDVLRRAQDRTRTHEAEDLLAEVGEVDGADQRVHVLTSRLAEVGERYPEVRDEVLRVLRGKLEEVEGGTAPTNTSFRVTPSLRETVRTRGQVLYTFPGPILDAFKTAAGQAAAAAGLGAALDQDHPLRGALVGAGAVLSIRAGMLGKTVGKLARAESRGQLRGVLEALDDQELGALAKRIERWNPRVSQAVSGEVQERALRATLDPGEIADRDIDLLARGPLKPLRERPGAQLTVKERDAIVRTYQNGDRELRHRIVDELERALDEAGPAQAEHYGRLIESLEAEGYGNTPVPLPARGNPAIDASRHVNLGKFALDPMGEKRLADHVRRVVEAEGLDPKAPVTWDQVREAAREIGVSPNDVAFLGKEGAGRMSGAEMLALRNQIRENVQGIEEISRHLAMFGETLPDAEREMLERVVAEAESQNSALLSRFVKARTQAGRDLNSLKILANQTLDPVVWEARAAKLLRRAGLTFTEEHRAAIRSILAECQ